MSNTQNNTFVSTTSNITNWSSIDWKKAEKYVDKIQKRIYRAESEGDYRKVRDLQRLLGRSAYVQLLAIRRVTQTNKGKRTAGIDGFRALSDKQRMDLFYKIRNRNINLHKPKPALRKYIEKKNGKMRPLSIPVIMDRIYQEILRMVLEPQWEFRFEPTSYGFRPKRSIHDAAERIFNYIHPGNWVYVYEGDFKSCFDNLDHGFILEQIKGFPYIKLVERFLKAGYVDNNMFYHTDKGTPQGGLLSPLLANIALNGMEDCLNISYKEVIYNRNGKPYTTYKTHGKYRMTRYADDFVIFAKTEEDILEIPNILEPYLVKRGLTLAEDKTKISHLRDGFDFLGLNFKVYYNKKGHKTLIKPSKDSIKKARNKISDIYEMMKGSNVDSLIEVVNPVIRGIANFWKPYVSKEIFSQMDHYIWIKNNKFLKWLHPKKSKKWIKSKYYPPYDDGRHKDNWTLTGPKNRQHIVKMAGYPIKRHTMIKFNYSPYDASKSDYFANR